MMETGQTSDHCPDRAVKVVKVKTIKARPPLGSHRGIMFSQPTHEGVHIGIAPHPCWKTLKGGLAIWSGRAVADIAVDRSEEHTSELQSLMRISYAVFCLKKKIIFLSLLY